MESQRRWAKFGAIYAAVVLLLGIGLFVGAALLMKNNGAFKDSMILLRTDPNVVDAMGEPIHDGWFVTGQISIGGDKGFANLVIPVSGPKCEGDAASRAGLLDGEWVVYSLIVNLDCLDTPITVVRPPN